MSDADTGLVYMQARYYDPDIGRFLSTDPIGSDGATGSNFNRYWYANNNPVTYLDPDGRVCIIAFNRTTEMCERSLRYEGIAKNPEVRNFTRFFGAASVVTTALALTLGADFLRKLSRELEGANGLRLESLRNGTLPSLGSVQANDYAFVHFEQSIVLQRLDQLKLDSPIIYCTFVATVNKTLNKIAPMGSDPNFAQAVKAAQASVGGGLDFGNQRHREALGRATVDVIRFHQPLCTGTHLRRC